MNLLDIVGMNAELVAIQFYRNSLHREFSNF